MVSFNPFGLVQSLMESHCGGRVKRHKEGSAPKRFPDLFAPGSPRCFTKIQNPKSKIG
ncbi:hypothetical protein [Nostoc sp.]|uniref:hypothetical protein n=1 Tax=Nostoc sp. TaxID=1180 RepID=UPI002FF81252